MPIPRSDERPSHEQPGPKRGSERKGLARRGGDTHGLGRGPAGSARAESDHFADLIGLRGRFVPLGAGNPGASLLDVLPGAAMLVSPQGLLLHANPAARALLASESLPLRGRHELARAFCSEGHSFKAAIGEVCERGGAGAFLIEQTEGPPIVATLLPYRGADGSVQALLLLPGRGGACDAAILCLQRLFGLTRSEAEICSALLEGNEPAKIAAERGVAVGTVRAQLKAAAAKLGCTRQTEIVRLVGQLPALCDPVEQAR